MSQEPVTPRGVVIVITNPAGAVVAQASDFAPSEAAGFKDYERQVSRAISNAAFDFAKNHLNRWIADYVESHRGDGFQAEYLEVALKAGYSMIAIPVGYPEAIAELVSKRSRLPQKS